MIPLRTAAEVHEAAANGTLTFAHLDPACCHKTRLLGAPCPLGRTCPYDEAAVVTGSDLFPALKGIAGPTLRAMLAEGSLLPHLPIRTPPEPTSPHDPRYWKC